MHGIPTAGRNPFSVFFWLVFVLVVCFGLCVLFWFVWSLMGLLTGLCIGPLPALLRLLTQLTALQANYNSACLLQLNVCNDLAKAMKALDGKKSPECRSFCCHFHTRPCLTLLFHRSLFSHHFRCDPALSVFASKCQGECHA